MATPPYILELIRKQLQHQTLSGEEKLQLEEWFNLRSSETTLFSRADWEEDLSTYLKLDADSKRMEQALQQFRKAAGIMAPPVISPDFGGSAVNTTGRQTDQKRRVGYLPQIPKWGWAAASILLLITATIFYFVSSERQVQSYNPIVRNTEIKPGKDGAILTLADGRQVVLDSLGNGLVATQNGVQIVLKNGQLAYDPATKTQNNTVYNTMSTPKGRQFHVILADGTQVWLNSASSIRYPITFSGSERKVEITGEAYLEVAPNARQPFFAKIDGKAEIEVLGTAFNVNAYQNEKSINTTLLEGSVRITTTSREGNKVRDTRAETVILKPGQQAQILHAGSSEGRQITVTSGANIEEAMAWRNSLFYFEGKDLGEVMRQLERWYDIEVVYEKGIPNLTFGGELRRDLSLEDLLKVLEASKVHFRIEEGRKLVVMP